MMKKLFVEIPTFEEIGHLVTENVLNLYFNRLNIVGIEEDKENRHQSVFWTIDGAIYYCPLNVEELLKLIN